MEIKAPVSLQDWLDDPEKAQQLTETFTDSVIDLLSSTGFWGTAMAGVLLALKFVPKFAPMYGGIASMISTLLAPKVHQDNIRKVEQYAGHYIKTVQVIEDVSNQLPNSHGVINVKRILKKITESDFHEAVQTITADVHPDRPAVLVSRSHSES